jgi:SAM-dependent methyltransferase
MRAARRTRAAWRRFRSRDVRVANRRPQLEGEPWSLDGLEVDGNVVRGFGWAFPPLRLLVDETAIFTLNGERMRGMTFQPRLDVAERFWQREGAEACGFEFSETVEGPIYPGGFLELSYLNSPSRLPRKLRLSWHCPDPQREAPLPSPAQRTRVLGNDNARGFVLTGATDFLRLKRALSHVTRRGFEDFQSVLDWGVGCGRLARYAARENPRAFNGCDIDGDNVAWCAANLPGRFVHSHLDPPLPFEAGAFDLVYGVSVFTHLREPLQDAWLAELRRVVRPGGMVAVTVHGQTAIEYAGLRPDEYVALKSAVAGAGILVSSANHQLDGAVDRPEEYVNVFHSVDYVKRHWSRWFEVAVILPGYVFTHDLVVLKRRSD